MRKLSKLMWDEILWDSSLSAGEAAKVSKMGEGLGLTTEYQFIRRCRRARREDPDKYRRVRRVGSALGAQRRGHEIDEGFDPADV